MKCVVIDEDYDDDDDDGGCKDNNCVEYSASTQHPFTDVKCLNVEVCIHKTPNGINGSSIVFFLLVCQHFL